MASIAPTPDATQNPALAAQAEILARGGEGRRMADAVRALAIDAVEAAKSGHPGMPMGMADVATVLFTKVLKYDAADPRWPDRDRFVLSAGHGSMLLYALLHLTGHVGMGIEEIRRFRQLHSPAAGHPEFGEHPGIEMTTGPLGQGISTAVGMALAERMLAARFGASLVDHRTWVIASDGDLQEGVSHEAVALAGHYGLSKLCVLWDDNHISIDGDTALSFSEDVLKRFQAYGWAVRRIDGHDPAAIEGAMAWAMRNRKPTLIACRTIIGFGAPTKAGTAGSHGSPLGAAEAAAAKELLGWTAPAFTVPEDLKAAWEAAGRRSAGTRRSWLKRLAKHPQQAEFDRAMAGRLPESWHEALAALRVKHAEEKPKIATRVASQRALEALVPSVPEMVGGSADLTGSNNTNVKGVPAIAPGNFSGRFVHWGVREHGMAAAMNGMALHGGVIPYSGTFLVFSDYMRPSIRLAALMRQRVIHVLTHDSIGLGEDGPTHQPVEHLPPSAPCRMSASSGLRMRWKPPSAGNSRSSGRTGPRCWRCPARTSLRCAATPARTAAPAVATCWPRRPAPARDAHRHGLGSSHRARRAGGAGSEGIPTALVSLPCWEIFAAQDASYRDQVLGSALRVGVEAAVGMGWERWLGTDGIFVGMGGFGASAPAEDLYRHFGITADAIAAAVKKRLV